MTKKPKAIRHHLDRRTEAIVASAVDRPDDELLDEFEEARWLGVSVQWLRLGRAQGYGPPFQRLGPNVIRYKRGTTRKWLDARTHQSTAEYAEETRQIRGRR